MPCYFPISMYEPRDGGRWTRDSRKADGPARLVPCGKCEGCHATRVAQWTVRLTHEAQRHSARPLMVTFTYSDRWLPADFSVSKRVVKLLMYRIRKRFGVGVRFYAVGEYGSREGATGRPHFHLILYALELRDLCDAEKTQSGFIQYRSPSLEACWCDPDSGELYGRVRVSYADRGTFSYVAGYVHKKLGGAKDDAAYMRVHPVTGEVLQVAREFALMSRRPGIGGHWFEEFSDTDARGEFLVVNGEKRGIPAYYRRRRDDLDAKEHGASWLRDVKEERRMEQDERLRSMAPDLTAERLAVRREVQRLRTANLARGGS